MIYLSSNKIIEFPIVFLFITVFFLNACDTKSEKKEIVVSNKTSPSLFMKFSSLIVNNLDNALEIDVIIDKKFYVRNEELEIDSKTGVIKKFTFTAPTGVHDLSFKYFISNKRGRVKVAYSNTIQIDVLVDMTVDLSSLRVFVDIDDDFDGQYNNDELINNTYEYTFQDVLSISKVLAPRMVMVPAGSFLMGSSKGVLIRKDNEGPQHKVTFAKPFAIGETEITFEEYRQYTEAVEPSLLPDDENWGFDNRPVINVSWLDAQNYVQWLSEQTGETYRLPTEAEWEYAARAGSDTLFSWGDELDRNNFNYGNDKCCRGKSVTDTLDIWVYTAPVKSFPPNNWGLYDTAGNVAEWVQDCEHENYVNSPIDGGVWEENCIGGTETENKRGHRGFSWLNSSKGDRLAYRFWKRPDDRIYDRGFRVVRELFPSSVTP